MQSHLLSTSAAARRLNVKAATLYAYVSRRLLQAYELPGHRGSWFDPVELDALSRRAKHPSEPRADLRVTSAVTLIEHGAYWYRGESPAALAASAHYEDVAEFLWTGRHDRAPNWPVQARAVAAARAAQSRLPADAPATDRLRVIVAMIGAADPMRDDLRAPGLIATARRLIATTIAALAARRGGGIAREVASWLSARPLNARGVRAIEQALILMADHELAASTLAVRVAASFRADPYSAVAAGLGAMAGTWHGGASRSVERMLAEAARGQGAERLIGQLLAQESMLPGFGHPLYPDGDPRVAALLPIIRSCGPSRDGDAILAVAAAHHLPPPNVDFALAMLSRSLGLRAGAAEGIFAVARLAGWLAHAIEEYASRTDFRLRAVYVGPRPSAPEAGPAKNKGRP